MPNLDKYNVRAQYDSIATEFAETRKKHIQPMLAEFLDQIKPNSKILELGCGSGRVYSYLKEKFENQNSNLNYTGVDFCEKLLSPEIKNEINFICADICNPVTPDLIRGPREKADYSHILCIAVLHHLTPNQIEKLLKNIKKISAQNSQTKIIFSVWNLNIDKYQKLERNSENQLWVPYAKSNGRESRILTERFCVAYEPKELKELFLKANFKILEFRQDKYNFYFKLNSIAN